jgi:hypothetical protein
LTTAACGGLRSTPDCRPRRALLHLSYSCAWPFGPAMLVTQDPNRPHRDLAAIEHIECSGIPEGQHNVLVKCCQSGERLIPGLLGLKGP